MKEIYDISENQRKKLYYRLKKVFMLMKKYIPNIFQRHLLQILYVLKLYSQLWLKNS